MTNHVNLFRLVFRTIIGLTAAGAIIGIWDVARCNPEDGGYERCDAKVDRVTAGLVALVPVFIAWIAPNRDGEPNDQPPSVAPRDLPVVPPSPVDPAPSPEAAWPSFETRNRPTPRPEFGEPLDPDNA